MNADAPDDAPEQKGKQKMTPRTPSPGGKRHTKEKVEKQVRRLMLPAAQWDLMRGRMMVQASLKQRKM